VGHTAWRVGEFGMNIDGLRFGEDIIVIDAGF